MKNSNWKNLSKYEQAYRDAKEKRHLASGKFGRTSDKFKKADENCKKIYAEYSKFCNLCAVPVN